MTDTALALIEPKNIELHFKPNGLDPIIERVRTLVSGFVADISTEKGRREIASLAYKVAKSKTTLDGMGKDLASGRKEEIKAIDAERKRAWDALEAIQHEVRAPLTEWENRDKARVAEHEAALAAIPEGQIYGQTETAADLAVRLSYLEGLPPRDWQEFSARASKVLADEIERTKILYAAAEKREADAAELARLRQEEADRQQRERDERLQAEAAAAAKAEAEEQARQQAEAEAARVRAQQEQAEQDRRRIEQEKEEAEARAAQAEADRQAAAEQAERDRVAAAEQAQCDAEAAAQAERHRIAAEQRAEAEAQAKREANKRHRAKIDGEAMKGLIDAGLSHDTALVVVDAVSRGQIPHLKLVY